MVERGIDLGVNLGGLEMPTPVATASGTFGYGTEYVGALDYAKLGAITVKGIRLEPWPGNAMPRHAEVPGGLVNAIGLQGSGIDHFEQITASWYQENAGAVPMIVNIWGGSVEEYAEVARRLTAFAHSERLSAMSPVRTSRKAGTPSDRIRAFLGGSFPPSGRRPIYP